jgi:hypothetical protein
MMKPETPVGAIPANVSENERAIVTAGLANEVDTVNQYAAVIEPDGVWCRGGCASDTSQDSQQQSEGRDKFRELLTRPIPKFCRYLQHRQIKHQMRDPNT